MKLNEIRLRALLCCAATITWVGCSGAPSDVPEVGVVTGVVTLDGSPLPNATVTFTPDKGRSSMGTTDDSGKYELRYTNELMGAKIGSHSVSITTERGGTEDEGGEGGANAAAPEKVPPKYNSETHLTAEVTAGDNVLDFDLQSQDP